MRSEAEYAHPMFDQATIDVAAEITCLQKEAEELRNLGYIKPSGSSLRSLAEYVCKYIQKKHNLWLEQNNQAGRIEELFNRGIIPVHLFERLNKIREFGNIASHPDKKLCLGNLNTMFICINELVSWWNVQYYTPIDSTSPREDHLFGSKSKIAAVILGLLICFFAISKLYSSAQIENTNPVPPINIEKYLNITDLQSGYSLKNGVFYTFDLPSGKSHVTVDAGTVALVGLDRRLTRVCSSDSFTLDVDAYSKMPLVASCDHQRATLRIDRPAAPFSTPQMLPEPVRPIPTTRAPPAEQLIQIRSVGATYIIQAGNRYGLDMLQGVTVYSILFGKLVLSQPNGQIDRACSSLGFSINVLPGSTAPTNRIESCGGGNAMIQVLSVSGANAQGVMQNQGLYRSAPGLGANNAPAWAPSRSHIYVTPGRGY